MRITKNRIKLSSNDCFELLKKIPKGRVTTYKIIAKKLSTNGYRAVGKIVGLNPNAPLVPCHRVVKSSGEVGGYAFGVDNKIKILKEEGVEVVDGKVKNFANLIYEF